MKLMLVGLAVLLVITASAAIFAYSGTFDVAADVPHSAAVNWLVAFVRKLPELTPDQYRRPQML